MARLEEQVFLLANAGFFGIGIIFSVLLLILGARHQWLVGYGREQRRIRVYISVVILAFIVLSLTAAFFNLTFV